MNHHPHSHWKIHLATLLGFCLCATLQLQAQPTPGSFGGYRGRSGSSSTSSRQYPNNGTVGDAVISIDPETRSLIVIADEDTGRYISQVVSNLDRPKPQVLIKVVFLEVTHNNSSDIGIEGAVNKGFGNPFTSGFITNWIVSGTNIVPSIVPNTKDNTASAANVFGLAAAGANPVPPGAGLYQIFAQDYQVTLRAIAQAGNAKVLSRPSIVARNNQPATITVGQSVPLPTASRFDNYGNVINSVSYQDVGIILRVTPFIMNDGMVEMIVSPETSDLVADRSQWVPISSGAGGVVSAPLIDSRSADTVVVTPDGQTVIIGGMMQNSKADSESKIPFLGDIPLLGVLFKHKIKSDAKSELLIFLTPHIIQAPTEMAGLSTHEAEKSDATKAFTEQELNKYLDNLPMKRPAPDKKSKSSKKKSSGSPDNGNNGSY